MISYRGNDGVDGPEVVLIQHEDEVLRLQQAVHHQSRRHGPCVARTIQINLSRIKHETKRNYNQDQVRNKSSEQLLL